MMLESYNNTELIKIISELSQIQAMRVIDKPYISSGLFVGVAAVLGGLIFGPRGIAAGSIIAGVAVLATSEDKFRSVSDILINDLRDDQKERLADSIRFLLTAENIMTVTTLSTELTSEADVKIALESIIKSFLKETFNYDV